jgi:hypothetical protein|tara:strand:- start:303 stop:827 length:525 start_codon:yes stop_codon:yes gene_type:complete
MITFFQALSLGATLLGSLQQKKRYDSAANAAQEVGEFNAQLIERDIGLLAKQQDIVNRNHSIFKTRRKIDLDRVQGSVKASTAYAGIDIASTTTAENLERNAREFDYEMATADFNNAVANMQIEDAKEDKRLSAELSRMEGGQQAASLRSQGTTALVRGLSTGVRQADEYGLFG